MGRIKRVSSFLNVFLLFLLCSVNVLYGAPKKAISIKQELESTPVCDHNPIYNKIHRDTSVLSNPSLRNTLVRITKKVWFKQYIKGDVLGLKSGSDLECRLDDGPHTLDNFVKLVSKMEGKDAIVIWTHLISYNPVGVPEVIFTKTKRNGEKFIKVLLSKVSYNTPRNVGEKNSNQNQSSVDSVREDDRRTLSDRAFSRLIYESVRSNWNSFDPGLRKRVKKFALRALKDPRNDIPDYKTFATAFFLDRGFTEDDIRQEVVQPKIESSDGPEIIEFYNDLMLKDAQEWRDEYPRWPLDEKKT